MTLIELIMVITLVTIIAGVISSIIYYEIDSFDLITVRNSQLQESRLGLQFMARDLRQIMSRDDIYQASEDSLRFKDVNDTMQSYKFQNNTILHNNDLLMQNVDEFEFSYFDEYGDALGSPVSDPSLIRSISFTVSTQDNGHLLSIENKVTPRNF